MFQSFPLAHTTGKDAGTILLFFSLGGQLTLLSFFPETEMNRSQTSSTVQLVFSQLQKHPHLSTERQNGAPYCIKENVQIFIFPFTGNERGHQVSAFIIQKVFKPCKKKNLCVGGNNPNCGQENQYHIQNALRE